MGLIFLNLREARELKDQKKITLVRLLREQPPEGYTSNGAVVDFTKKGHDHRKIYEYYDAYVFMNEDGSDFRIIPLRYPPGRNYKAKEPWEYSTDKEGNLIYIYKADHPNCTPAYNLVRKEYNGNLVELESRAIKWHSPATMPPEAIRWHDLVVKTSVKRVGELSYLEVWNLGYRADDHMSSDRAGQAIGRFVDHWNSLHAKPVKQGDKYVCYPYDRLKFVREYFWGKKKFKPLKTGHTWKGKELIIYPNPYVEINELERK